METRKIIVCKECGETRPKSAGDLCHKCYLRVVYHRNKNKRGKWSEEYRVCVSCNSKRMPYKGWGLCHTCYNREFRNGKLKERIITATKKTICPQCKSEVKKTDSDVVDMIDGTETNVLFFHRKCYWKYCDSYVEKMS